jgi:hypothetical protein
MIWAAVKYVARRVAGATRSQGDTLTASGKAPHGPVTITASKSKPDGAQSMLTARAYRLHNRNKAGAERYLALHRTLAKGRCFDGQ